MKKKTCVPVQFHTPFKIVVLGSTALALSGHAMADEGASAATSQRQAVTLEEIVVTSQKREERLQDVPISVATMGGEKIQQSGAIKLEDVTASIPTLHVGEAQIGNQLFIRGIGSGVNAGFEQSVGTYIDGLYYGRGRMSAASFLDIERIEVLKGPQGTLFGKNTIAGALNITTAKPTRDFEGYVSAQYGITFEEPILEGVISGPVSETLAVRVAGRWSELNRGWIENEFRDRREPQSKTAIGRISVLWTPTEEFELQAKATVNRFTQNGRNSELIDAGGAYFGNPGSQAALLAPFGESGILDHKRNVGGTPGTAFDRDRTANTIQSYGLTANYYMDDLTLTSITGYVTYDANDTQDNDLTPLDLMAMEVGEDYKQFSQEFRVTSPKGETLEYILGAYYQNDTLDALQYINISALQIRQAGYAAPPLYSGRHLTLHQKTESWAVFGQFKANITDTFAAALGLRYSEDKKSVLQKARLTAFNQPDVPLSSNPAMPAGAAPGAAQVGIWGRAPLFTWEHDIDTSRKESHFTPSLQLTWHATDDVMLYSSAGKGYKSGGYDAFFARYSGIHSGPIPTDGGALDSFEFEDEKVKAVEVGAKTTLLDGAAELNIAAFYSKFSDVQVSTFSGGIDVNVQNAATTISRGVEVDGRWRLSNALTATTSVAYVDSYYKNFTNAECYFGQQFPDCAADPASGLSFQDLSGRTTQYSPKWNAHLDLEHVLPLGDSFILTTLLGVSYSSKYYVPADMDPRLVQDKQAIVDLRIGLSDVDGRWELAVIGKNLTDQDTFSWANDTPLGFGGAYAHINRLRSFAIQAKYNF